MSKEQPRDGYKWRPATYGIYYGIIKEIAEDHGYALTLHGSFNRDMDVVAIPWIENPKPVMDMLEEIRLRVGFLSKSTNDKPYNSMEEKPHGRIAYQIIMGTGALDISVMPLVHNLNE